MKRVLASLILVALMAGPAAADLDVTFETVDEVERVDWEEHELRVRGIPQGQTEPIQVAAIAGNRVESQLLQATACERMALLATSRPGRYLFRIVTTESNGRELLNRCRLIRR
jgi:hypothetical protein